MRGQKKEPGAGAPGSKCFKEADGREKARPKASMPHHLCTLHFCTPQGRKGQN